MITRIEVLVDAFDKLGDDFIKITLEQKNRFLIAFLHDFQRRAKQKYEAKQLLPLLNKQITQRKPTQFIRAADFDPNDINKIIEELQKIELELQKRENLDLRELQALERNRLALDIDTLNLTIEEKKAEIKADQQKLDAEKKKQKNLDKYLNDRKISIEAKEKEQSEEPLAAQIIGPEIIKQLNYLKEIVNGILKKGYNKSISEQKKGLKQINNCFEVIENNVKDKIDTLIKKAEAAETKLPINISLEQSAEDIQKGVEQRDQALEELKQTKKEIDQYFEIIGITGELPSLLSEDLVAPLRLKMLSIAGYYNTAKVAISAAIPKKQPTKLNSSTFQTFYGIEEFKKTLKAESSKINEIQKVKEEEALKEKYKQILGLIDELKVVKEIGSKEFDDSLKKLENAGKNLDITIDSDKKVKVVVGKLVKTIKEEKIFEFIPHVYRQVEKYKRNFASRLGVSIDNEVEPLGNLINPSIQMQIRDLRKVHDTLTKKEELIVERDEILTSLSDFSSNSDWHQASFQLEIVEKKKVLDGLTARRDEISEKADSTAQLASALLQPNQQFQPDVLKLTGLKREPGIISVFYQSQDQDKKEELNVLGGEIENFQHFARNFFSVLNRTNQGKLSQQYIPGVAPSISCAIGIEPIIYRSAEKKLDSVDSICEYLAAKGFAGKADDGTYTKLTSGTGKWNRGKKSAFELIEKLQNLDPMPDQPSTADYANRLLNSLAELTKTINKTHQGQFRDRRFGSLGRDLENIRKHLIANSGDADSLQLHCDILDFEQSFKQYPTFVQKGQKDKSIRVINEEVIEGSTHQYELMRALSQRIQFIKAGNHKQKKDIVLSATCQHRLDALQTQYQKALTEGLTAEDPALFLKAITSLPANGVDLDILFGDVTLQVVINCVKSKLEQVNLGDSRIPVYVQALAHLFKRTPLSSETCSIHWCLIPLRQFPEIHEALEHNKFEEIVKILTNLAGSAKKIEIDLSDADKTYPFDKVAESLIKFTAALDFKKPSDRQRFEKLLSSNLLPTIFEHASANSSTNLKRSILDASDKFKNEMPEDEFIQQGNFIFNTAGFKSLDPDPDAASTLCADFVETRFKKGVTDNFVSLMNISWLKGVSSSLQEARKVFLAQCITETVQNYLEGLNRKEFNTQADLLLVSTVFDKVLTTEEKVVIKDFAIDYILKKMAEGAQAEKREWANVLVAFIGNLKIRGMVDDSPSLERKTAQAFVKYLEGILDESQPEQVTELFNFLVSPNSRSNSQLEEIRKIFDIEVDVTVNKRFQKLAQKAMIRMIDSKIAVNKIKVQTDLAGFVEFISDEKVSGLFKGNKRAQTFEDKKEELINIHIKALLDARELDKIVEKHGQSLFAAGQLKNYFNKLQLKERDLFIERDAESRLSIKTDELNWLKGFYEHGNMPDDVKPAILEKINSFWDIFKREVWAIAVANELEGSAAKVYLQSLSAFPENCEGFGAVKNLLECNEESQEKQLMNQFVSIRKELSASLKSEQESRFKDYIKNEHQTLFSESAVEIFKQISANPEDIPNKVPIDAVLLKELLDNLSDRIKDANVVTKTENIIDKFIQNPKVSLTSDDIRALFISGTETQKTYALQVWAKKIMNNRAAFAENRNKPWLYIFNDLYEDETFSKLASNVKLKNSDELRSLANRLIDENTEDAYRAVEVIIKLTGLKKQDTEESYEEIIRYRRTRDSLFDYVKTGQLSKGESKEYIDKLVEEFKADAGDPITKDLTAFLANERARLIPDNGDFEDTLPDRLPTFHQLEVMRRLSPPIEIGRDVIAKAAQIINDNLNLGVSDWVYGPGKHTKDEIESQSSQVYFALLLFFSFPPEDDTKSERESRENAMRFYYLLRAITWKYRDKGEQDHTSYEFLEKTIWKLKGISRLFSWMKKEKEQDVARFCQLLVEGWTMHEEIIVRELMVKDQLERVRKPGHDVDIDAANKCMDERNRLMSIKIMLRESEQSETKLRELADHKKELESEIEKEKARLGELTSQVETHEKNEVTLNQHKIQLETQLNESNDALLSLDENKVVADHSVQLKEVEDRLLELKSTPDVETWLENEQSFKQCDDDHSKIALAINSGVLERESNLPMLRELLGKKSGFQKANKALEDIDLVKEFCCLEIEKKYLEDKIAKNKEQLAQYETKSKQLTSDAIKSKSSLDESEQQIGQCKTEFNQLKLDKTEAEGKLAKFEKQIIECNQGLQNSPVLEQDEKLVSREMFMITLLEKLLDPDSEIQLSVQYIEDIAFWVQCIKGTNPNYVFSETLQDQLSALLMEKIMSAPHKWTDQGFDLFGALHAHHEELSLGLSDASQKALKEKLSIIVPMIQSTQIYCDEIIAFMEGFFKAPREDVAFPDVNHIENILVLPSIQKRLIKSLGELKDLRDVFSVSLFKNAMIEVFDRMINASQEQNKVGFEEAHYSLKSLLANQKLFEFFDQTSSEVKSITQDDLQALREANKGNKVDSTLKVALSKALMSLVETFPKVDKLGQGTDADIQFRKQYSPDMLENILGIAYLLDDKFHKKIRAQFETYESRIFETDIKLFFAFYRFRSIELTALDDRVEASGLTQFSSDDERLKVLDAKTLLCEFEKFMAEADDNGDGEKIVEFMGYFTTSLQEVKKLFLKIMNDGKSFKKEELQEEIQHITRLYRFAVGYLDVRQNESTLFDAKILLDTVDEALKVTKLTEVNYFKGIQSNEGRLRELAGTLLLCGEIGKPEQQAHVWQTLMQTLPFVSAKDFMAILKCLDEYKIICVTKKVDVKSLSRLNAYGDMYGSFCQTYLKNVLRFLPETAEYKTSEFEKARVCVDSREFKEAMRYLYQYNIEAFRTLFGGYLSAHKKSELQLIIDEKIKTILPFDTSKISLSTVSNAEYPSCPMINYTQINYTHDLSDSLQLQKEYVQRILAGDSGSKFLSQLELKKDAKDFLREKILRLLTLEKVLTQLYLSKDGKEWLESDEVKGLRAKPKVRLQSSVANYYCPLIDAVFKKAQQNAVEQSASSSSAVHKNLGISAGSGKFFPLIEADVAFVKKQLKKLKMTDATLESILPEENDRKYFLYNLIAVGIKYEKSPYGKTPDPNKCPLGLFGPEYKKVRPKIAKEIMLALVCNDEPISLVAFEAYKVSAGKFFPHNEQAGFILNETVRAYNSYVIKVKKLENQITGKFINTRNIDTDVFARDRSMISKKLFVYGMLFDEQGKSLKAAYGGSPEIDVRVSKLATQLFGPDTGILAVLKKDRDLWNWVESVFKDFEQSPEDLGEYGKIVLEGWEIFKDKILVMAPSDVFKVIGMETKNSPSVMVH